MAARVLIVYLIALASEHVSAEINDTGGSGVDEVRFAATSASTLTLFANDKGLERVVLGTGTGAVATTTGTAAPQRRCVGDDQRPLPWSAMPAPTC
jgi:hypothetical protein